MSFIPTEDMGWIPSTDLKYDQPVFETLDEYAEMESQNHNYIDPSQDYSSLQSVPELAEDPNAQQYVVPLMEDGYPVPSLPDYLPSQEDDGSMVSDDLAYSSDPSVEGFLVDQYYGYVPQYYDYMPPVVGYNSCPPSFQSYSVPPTFVNPHTSHNLTPDDEEEISSARERQIQRYLAKRSRRQSSRGT